MKRFFGAVFVTLLMVAGSVKAFAEESAKFNVATYNLRQLNDGDRKKGDGWERRCPVVASVIRFHDFHIFGTQEGFKSQLEDLKAQLPGYEYTGVARDDGKEAGEHSAIFYDTNMFELLDHGDFWLSETPDRPGLGWDAACVRICSWGKFRHKESGKEFQFYNLHLDHVGKKARVESVLLVQKKMKEIGMNLPTFLTGDFNVDQTHDMYDVLAGSDFLLDSFKTAEFVYAPNGTWNDYKTDGFTESRIDHIFVSDGVKVEKYGVLTDTYRTSRDEDRQLGYEKSSIGNNSGSDSQNYKSANFPEELKISPYKSRVPSDHFPVQIKVVIP